MESLSEPILNLLVKEGKSEDEVFEMVNAILIKYRRSKKGGEKKGKGKVRRRPICRPVLLISDSSDDEIKQN